MKNTIWEPDTLWEPKEHKTARDEVIKNTGKCPCGIDCSTSDEFMKCPLPAHVVHHNYENLANMYLEKYQKQLYNTVKYWRLHGKHRSCKDPDIIFIQKLWDKFLDNFVIVTNPVTSLPVKM